jgi:hypothetical protein
MEHRWRSALENAEHSFTFLNAPSRTGLIPAFYGVIFSCQWQDSGTKSWIFRYQINKRCREVGFGTLAGLPPVEPRAEAAGLMALIRQGVKPPRR